MAQREYACALKWSQVVPHGGSRNDTICTAEIKEAG